MLYTNLLVMCYMLAGFIFHRARGDSAPAGAGWSYTGSLGPNEWPTQYPICGGRMQSPINIDRSLVLYDQLLQSFDLRQYKTCTDCKMILKNVDGHTAEVIYEGSPIYIHGGSLPDDYILDQFHFHWGKANNEGSEHLLDNRAFALEMHVVHHMAKMKNKTEAAANPYGLAVLGFFFQVGTHNKAFESLLSHFKDIIHINNKTELPPFALADLLPQEAGNSYYRYYGSLTTPPCYETVIWTIFTTKINISQQQLEIFRTLRTMGNGSEEELSNDYRPVQELHERRVTSNDKTLFTDISKGIVGELRRELSALKDICTSGGPIMHRTSAMQKVLFLLSVIIVCWLC